jgi:hypothetical protein
VLGGILNVLSTATIDGDVIFYGGTATIGGKVKGSVLGAAEKIRVDATVGKNVDVKTVQSLTLGDTASIDGYVRYVSSKDVERGQNATVKGEIQKTEVPTLDAGTKSMSLFSLLPLLISLFSTLVLFLLFRKVLEAMVLMAHKHGLKVSLVGLGALIFGPALTVVLMLTGLGLFIGIMTLSLLMFVFVLGYALAGVVLGSYLAKWFTNHPRVTLPWVVLGTVLVHGFLFIPVVGLLVVIALTVVTIGSLIFVLGKNAINA